MNLTVTAKELESLGFEREVISDSISESQMGAFPWLFLKKYIGVTIEAHIEDSLTPKIYLSRPNEENQTYYKDINGFEELKMFDHIFSMQTKSVKKLINQIYE